MQLYQNLRSTKLNGDNDNTKDELNTIGLEVSNVESLKTDTLRTIECRNVEFLAVQVCTKSTLPYD